MVSTPQSSRDTASLTPSSTAPPSPGSLVAVEIPSRSGRASSISSSSSLSSVESDINGSLSEDDDDDEEEEDDDDDDEDDDNEEEEDESDEEEAEETEGKVVAVKIVNRSPKGKKPTTKKGAATTTKAQKGKGKSLTPAKGGKTKKTTTTKSKQQQEKVKVKTVPAESASKITNLKENMETSTWEVAYVFAFLLKFQPILKQIAPLNAFSSKDLDDGLVAETSNEFIEQVHCNLLSNMLNRKKAVDEKSWQRLLHETMDTKQKLGEYEDDNPMQDTGNYYTLSTPSRIFILKQLVNWVLQESQSVRESLDVDKVSFSVEPFGIDQSKRVYYYFGPGSTTVYRETNPSKKTAIWETVADSLETLKILADSFGLNPRSVNEKTLQDRLRTEIIEPVEEYQTQQTLKLERQEKKMLRLAELHQMAAMRSTRTRSSNRLNQPKYTFDDEEEELQQEEDAYEYAGYTNRGGASSSSLSAATQDRIETENGNDQLVVGGNSRKDRLGSVDSEASDSSIRKALKRTRVGEQDDDDEKEDEQEENGLDRRHRSPLVDVMVDDDQEDQMLLETKIESVMETATTTRLATLPVKNEELLIAVTAPVEKEEEDVEMKETVISDEAQVAARSILPPS